MDINQIFTKIEEQKDFIKMAEDFQYFFKEYEMGLLELTSDIDIIDLEWQARYGYSPFEHVKTRIKAPLSLRDKLNRKGIEMSLEAIRENIFDIIGVRIVTTFEEDVYKICELLSGRSDLRVVRVKDYIKNPKPSGYKSLHLIVETELVLSQGVKWIPAEIQIRTLAMDFFASTEHKLQYKYNTKQLSDAIRKELREVADASAELDRKMTEVRNTILLG